MLKPKIKTMNHNSKKWLSPHPYEIFIGGWVHFYDSQVQHGDSDHAVYFDWDYKCKMCNSLYITIKDT